MNFLEIMNNLWAALFILAVVAVGYLVFIIKHPHSETARDVFKESLKGCAIDFGVWFAIVVFAVLLATQSIEAERLFVQVIGTKFLTVTLITWSMVAVPIAFNIHKAYGGFDYRAIVIGFFVVVAFLCGIYYMITGYPLF